MSLGVLLSTPYYEGTGVTEQVPGKFPIALNGVGYFLDTKMFAQLTARSTIPVLRQQADNSNIPGLSSLNPEDLWRRDQQTWHHGAGQSVLDREDSDPARFSTSKGVDGWTKWALTLLPDTTQRRASANTNLAMAVAGSRLYLTDGTALAFTTDLTAFTTVTGTGAAAPSSVVSNGFKVFTAHGANGVYVTDTTVSAATQMVSSAVSATAVLGYVKGRLMLGSDNVLYNITDLVGPAALPAALTTHADSNFRWVDFAPGQAVLYAAGFSGDKSLIYKISIQADGTALNAPSVAGELPDGEIVRSIAGYLGYVLVGTDKGLRFAAADTQGNLQIGGLIPTSSTVSCFEGQDRFVWYGLSNYDALSTGLGRLDLSVFTTPLVPAYATDLMVTGQGAVTSVVTFRSVRVLAVSGLGFYEQSTSKVTSGTLDSGAFTYGISDAKVAVFLDVRHAALPAGSVHEVSLAVDGEPFGTLGSHTSGGAEGSFNARQQRGEKFEYRLSMTRATDPTQGPTVTRVTLRSWPSVARGEVFLVPLMLAESYTPGEGKGPRQAQYIKDVAAARQALFDLATTPQLVTYQEGMESWPVFVRDVEWHPTHRTKGGEAWNGTALVKLSTVRG